MKILNCHTTCIGSHS